MKSIYFFYVKYNFVFICCSYFIWLRQSKPLNDVSSFVILSAFCLSWTSKSFGVTIWPKAQFILHYIHLNYLYISIANLIICFGIFRRPTLIDNNKNIKMRFALILVIFCIFQCGFSVDPGNFKTCDQSSFCRRCRKVPAGNSKYALVPGSLNTYSDSITAELTHKDNHHLFVFKLQALAVSFY